MFYCIVWSINLLFINCTILGIRFYFFLSFFFTGAILSKAMLEIATINTLLHVYVLPWWAKTIGCMTLIFTLKLFSYSWCPIALQLKCTAAWWWMPTAPAAASHTRPTWRRPSPSGAASPWRTACWSSGSTHPRSARLSSMHRKYSLRSMSLGISL